MSIPKSDPRGALSRQLETRFVLWKWDFCEEWYPSMSDYSGMAGSFLCCASPLKSSRDSSTLVSKQSSTHCSHGSRRAFDMGVGRTHGPHDHGDGSQSQLYPYHRKRQKEQVTTPQERCPTGICPGAPSLQHLHLWPANHRFQKVCICWRSSNHACWWRLAGSGWGANQGHGNARWMPPDLEAKAQHYKNGVGGLPIRNKKKAKGELKVNFNNETLSFCSEPKYLGVMLDRSLTYRWNLESLCKKLTFHVALLRRAGATMLWIATLPLVHSAAEYCAPVWCCSAHTRLIDPTLNDDLWIVTGCLHPTPADNLAILAGIQPAELCCSGATLSLGCRSMERGHLLHSVLTHPSSTDAWGFKSRHPFVPAIQQLMSFSDNKIHTLQWADHQWNVVEWADNSTRLHFNSRHQYPPPAMTSQEEPGSSSTASTPVSDVSAPVSTNGVWPPLQPVSVTQKNKPSTSPWTARPDGPGWWDNWMAAQHLP